MAADAWLDELAAAFAPLGAQAVDVKALQREAHAAHLPAGAFIGLEGDACGGLALVLRGTARVYKSGAGGREVTLYRLGRGDSCILTATCILSDTPFPAFAVAETDVEAVVVPAAAFRRWVAERPAWRQYVFDLLSDRLLSVLEVVEGVTFRRLEGRLAAALLATAEHGDTVHATHEHLATDVGSTREAVSRQLKAFEREGWVRLGRGRVEVIDASALRRVVEKDALR